MAALNGLPALFTRPTTSLRPAQRRGASGPRRATTMNSTGKAFVIGNWACNGSNKMVHKLVEELNNQEQVDEGVEAVIAPPVPYVNQIREALYENTHFSLGAQNLCIGRGGFTGEVSAEILKDLQCSWVIVGHSDRRSMYAETNEQIGKKITHALEVGLKVVACVGENVDQHFKNSGEEVLETQLNAIAAAIDGKWDQLVIAYEPAWAIGTKVHCTPEQAEERAGFIRRFAAKRVPAEQLSRLRIIFGGPINGRNAYEYIQLPNVDGFLVGGASLIGSDFVTVCNSFQKRPGWKSSYGPTPTKKPVKEWHGGEHHKEPHGAKDKDHKAASAKTAH